MLVAVPAIPPKPKIAAIIAITMNINAHPNMQYSQVPLALSPLGFVLLRDKLLTSESKTSPTANQKLLVTSHSILQAIS